jgi:uncharacterized protein involved in type VI secretion and phage assembly
MSHPPFERAPGEGTPTATFGHVHLGLVVDDVDPDGKLRVKVRLLSCHGPDGQDGEVWARVAQTFAGDGYGAVHVPRVDEEVLVAFVAGDPSWPIIVGALYNGKNAPPERLADGPDRWTFVTPRGSRFELSETSSGQPTILLETPGGVRAELTDDGNKATIETGGTTVEIRPDGVSVDTSGTVSVQGTTVNVSASSVSVDTPYATFSGTVQVQTIIATSVVGTTYTPGAGNVW